MVLTNAEKKLGQLKLYDQIFVHQMKKSVHFSTFDKKVLVDQLF